MLSWPTSVLELFSPPAAVKLRLVKKKKYLLSRPEKVLVSAGLGALTK